MKMGSLGTFVISWMQTEIDALSAPPIGALAAGAVWRWTGSASRIGAPRDVPILDRAEGSEDVHRRAAANLRPMLGTPSLESNVTRDQEDDGAFLEAGFDITDGNRIYRVTLLRNDDTPPLLSFADDVPPADTDLWVVGTRLSPLISGPETGRAQGTICFTPGTRIATPNGPCPVEELEEGDWVSTKDDGDQPVVWIGRRQISGARMHALPHLRPVRLRANVLGQDEPDADLVVSPDHRILVKGPMSQVLFNTEEVLVAARDLLNDATITIDHSMRSVTYIHLMLPSHQIVWANGIETESFNPGLAALDVIEREQQNRLFDCLPDLRRDPGTYGMPVRRMLNRAEASLLQYQNR